MAGVTKNNKLLAANVRSLALEQIIAGLNGDDENFRKQLLLKLAGAVLPRLNEHTGEDGEPIKYNLVNYGQLGDTIPLQTAPIPTGDTTSSTEVQDSGNSSSGGEVKDGTEPTD